MNWNATKEIFNRSDNRIEAALVAILSFSLPVIAIHVRVVYLIIGVRAADSYVTVTWNGDQ